MVEHLGIVVGFLALFMCIFWLFLIIRKRQIGQLREKYFKQNGGNLLQHQPSQREDVMNKLKYLQLKNLRRLQTIIKIVESLDKEARVQFTKGSYPIIECMVAIKKSRIGDRSKVEPFINEITMLYRSNHRNVVKLLECCLETPVPLLVYEYVTNGTVSDHMYNVVTASSFLPWETRFRIATETVEALSYLHSYASISIIHRDIKLANILLDEKYTAKVNDFGASRLIPSDQAQVTTIVQGTFGYLDPEYVHTGLLTEKSDVHSFGVVLIDLLTGQKVFVLKERKKTKF